MIAFDALRDLTTQLSQAACTDDIGRALLKVAGRFHLTSALIIDASRLFNRVGPAFIFATPTRAAVEAFDLRQPFVDHPFTVQARASERPFLMSHLRKKMGLDEETWHSILPRSLKDTDGMVVPVHEDGKLAWCAAFAGAQPDLSQRAQSVMSAAVHAAYARFHQLLDAKTSLSPLSRRESECLKWVADGKTDFEVGKILHISPRTVRFHINNAKAKLGVATRIQAVAKRIVGTA